MEPNFTDEQWALINKKPLTLSEMRLLKKLLIKYVEEYLSPKKGDNSYINLTDVLKNELKVADANDNFIRDIGKRMERGRKYVVYENRRTDGTYEVSVGLANKSWVERNSLWVNLGSLVLGGILTVGGDVVKSHLEKEPDTPVYIIEDSRIPPLYDSVSNLSKEVHRLKDKTNGK